MGEATGSSKVAKGSAIILIGNVIFRVGGYLYRFLMASLLGPAAYGILGLTTPFQGIFQVLSAAGLPPAIAKYVSEYNALDEEDLARQTVFTALKIMVFLGFFFGLIMVFVAAPIITNYYHKPEALLPLQAVGLITPFSVIVGAFRGAFQGVYKMEYILYTRAIEQIFMILFATALVILGLSTFGAVLGSVLGFAASAVSAVYIFKRYMGKYIPPANPDFKFSLRQELGLAKRLLFFSIPVTITALAEMGIYPNVVNLDVSPVRTYRTIEEAIDNGKWNLAKFSEEEQKLLPKYLKSALDENEEGLLSNKDDKPDWVLIWWKK